MPLQTQRLVMVGLGSCHDTPPDAIQPPLRDGVHLRWAFARPLGFPWYGFFLFRRDHLRGEPFCLSRGTTNLKPTSWPTPSLSIPYGEFTSDRNLLLTDEFAPTPAVEFDLADRRYLRFTLTPDRLSHAVDVRVGFRGTDKADRQCLRFVDRQAGRVVNPHVESGFRVSARGLAGGAPPAYLPLRPLTRTGNPFVGLECGDGLEIALPEPAAVLTLQVSSERRDGVQIDADHAGNAAPAIMIASSNEPFTYDVHIEGRDIRSLRITAKDHAHALLHSVCFYKRRAAGPARIRVTAQFGGIEVAHADVTGLPGQIVTVRLAADAITSVELSGGPAALIDLCFEQVAQGATAGWKPIDGFEYPLALPVRHPDYPANAAPTDLNGSRATALARITYGPPTPWSAAFPDLHNTLRQLVAGGPPGTPMADKLMPAIAGVPPAPDAPAPRLSNSRPLNLVMLASLNRAVADMVGLSYVDETAVPGSRYDYLIVASHTGAGQRTANNMLNEIAANGFANVDGYIVFNKAVEPAAPLAAPIGVRSYALPGTTLARQGNAITDATNNAGLRWTLGISGGILAPGRPVLHVVWRADEGNAAAPVAGPFKLLTESPVLVAEPVLPPGAAPQRSSDWPPFPLHYIDIGLAEGWYGYRASGVDIFGRHSPQSSSAEWYQWAPTPDPRPWYYVNPPVETVIHASAVRLLDKTPPPPPTAIEAFTLDPADRTVLKDAAYQAWFNTLSAAEQQSVVGLRVRWQWTADLMRQAPDAAEFRIYYTGGRPNVRLGDITAVSVASATESLVTTNVPNAAAADAYVGASLRIGALAFPIVASSGASPLSLRVRNLGLTASTGTVSVANNSADVTGSGTAWHAGMIGLHFNIAGTAEVYTVLNVSGPTSLRLSSVYAGPTAAAQGYTIFDLRPPASGPATITIPERYAEGSVSVSNGSANVTGSGTNWKPPLVGMPFTVEGDAGRYRVAAVTSATAMVLDRPYGGPSRTNLAYKIEFPLFTDYRTPTNWDDRFYVVGYNQHVHVTNDSAGRPLRKYEVLIPAAADAFRSGVPLTTSLADPIAYAQVSVSTSDNRAHTPDAAKWAAGHFGNRPGNEGDVGAMSTIFRVRQEPPPAPTPPPDAERVFATPADYHSESFYTYRWIPAAGLRTHIFRAVDDALCQEDWRQRPRPAMNPADVSLFPPSEPRWDLLKRQQVAAELDQLNAFAHTLEGKAQAFALYRSLSNDGLRILAGLPGNDHAFTQITTIALDPADPSNADRRGPDSPAAYAPNPALRAYIDTLDGRSTSRYFYRAAYVDGANNTSALSLSSPPVWLPNVVPPRSPVLTRILGGDRTTTVSWASNREPDLARYRVYRTESEAASRDVRLMTLVHDTAVAAGDPAARPAEVLFTDTPLPGLVTFYYRLVAVDIAGNVSAPSPAATGRAFDESLPVTPVPTVAWTAVGGVMRAEVTWTSADETTLQRREPGRSWVEVASWRVPGTYTVRDPFSDPLQTYEYRLWSRKATGAVSKGAPVTLAHQ